MNRVLVFALLCLTAVAGCNPYDMFDQMITYERMTDQESFRPYEAKMPGVVAGTVPTTKSGEPAGEEQYKLAPLGSLQNPLPATAEIVARGEKSYGYFCIQCHGSRYNGDGTVGQSFAPLPTDLMSAYVQGMSADGLFRSISYGIQRHPPMFYTVSVGDRWAIIRWIQSLGERPETEKPIPSGDYERSAKGLL